MPEPILTLWELQGVAEVAVGTLNWGSVDRGQESAEKTLRIYNNKGNTGVSSAVDVKLTTIDPAGGNSLELIQGTPGVSFPMERAKCISLVTTSENEDVVNGGGVGGSVGPFPLAYGASNTFVAGSSVARREIELVENGTAVFHGSTTELKITIGESDVDGAPNAANPISHLPDTIDAGGKTYDTTGWWVDRVLGNVVYLDPLFLGQPVPPAGNVPCTVNGEDARYLKTQAEGVDYTVDASGSPAQVIFIVAVAVKCRGWMDYNYATPDTGFDYIGGSSYMKSIGGLTDELKLISAQGQNIAASIPDGGYAEVVVKIVVPSDANPSANIASKLKVLYDWS